MKPQDRACHALIGVNSPVARLPSARPHTVCDYRLRHRRAAFTLPELLVAMAMIVLSMEVLGESFSAGIEAFRSMKAIGDLAERLRGEAIELRRDLEDTNEATSRFIVDALRMGDADRAEASALRQRYRAICASAQQLEAGLSLIDPTNPGLRRIQHRLLGSTCQIKANAATMIELLWLVDTGDFDP